jgi:hypothetical protein
MAAVLSRSWFKNILAFIDPEYVVTLLVPAKPTLTAMRARVQREM